MNIDEMIRSESIDDVRRAARHLRSLVTTATEHADKVLENSGRALENASKTINMLKLENQKSAIWMEIIGMLVPTIKDLNLFAKVNAKMREGIAIGKDKA